MNKIKNFLAFLMIALLEATFITCATDGSYTGLPEEKFLIALAIILGIYMLYCIYVVFTKQKMELPPVAIFKFFFFPLFLIMYMFIKKDKNISKRRETERRMEEKFWAEYERWFL